MTKHQATHFLRGFHTGNVARVDYPDPHRTTYGAVAQVGSDSVRLKDPWGHPVTVTADDLCSGYATMTLVR